MAYESFPNDQHNDRAVTLAEHEQIVVPFGVSGFLNYTGAPPIYADSTGRQVKLRSGISASIRGTRFNSPTETIIPIAANTSGNTRVDLVVLRLRRQESSVGAGDRYTVAPFVIQGVPAAVNPTAPAPVQDLTPGVGVFDLPMAAVTVVNGSITITSAQQIPRAYYVTGSGYTGRDAWAKPPADPGALFWAADTGVAYVATAAGAWLMVAPFTLPVVPLATGANGSPTVGTTETIDDILGMYTFTAVAGVRYRVTLSGRGLNQSAAGDRFSLRLRYTTDGSTPTAASALLEHDTTVANAAASSPGTQSVVHVVQFVPGAATVKVVASWTRLQGTGTATPVGQCSLWAEAIGTV